MGDVWQVIPVGLWAALLFGGFAFGRADADNRYRIPTRARLASSLMLVLWAWLWVLMQPVTGPQMAVAVGMTLGFIGDLFMARWIALGPYPLGGMGAFGLGHVAYIAGLMMHGSAATSTARALAWSGWLLVAAVAWWMVVYRPAAQRETIHYAALPYALLLASTAGVAHGLALGSGLFVPLTVGAGLFLFSDLLIAAELFGGVRFPLIGDAIWLTYGPAQALIVGSALWMMG